MDTNASASGVVWGSFGERPGHRPSPGITMKPMTGDRVMLCWVEIEPNAILPLHHHPHEQGGVVMEGELILTVAGETKRLGPGDGFVIPGGVEHSAIGGPDGARSLDVFTPPRADFLA